MLKKFIAAVAFWGVAMFGAVAQAQEFGSKEEAVAMVERALALYQSQGLDALSAAVNDKGNTSFHDRDLYVFVFGIDGMTLAHGANEKLVGKDLSKLADQNGVQIIQEMIKVVQSGKPGWVDYHWPHPVTQQLTAKSAYASGFDNGTKFLGVGVYAQ